MLQLAHSTGMVFDMNRKFKLGDKVTIKLNSTKDYGRFLGKTGTVVFVGPMKSGVPMYHVKISNDDFDVSEHNLEFSKVNESINVRTFINAYAKDVLSLRKSDVYNMFSACPKEDRKKLADYILNHRKDLAKEVEDVLSELTESKKINENAASKSSFMKSYLRNYSRRRSPDDSLETDIMEIKKRTRKILCGWLCRWMG